jgi:hypothetical protein
MSGARYPIDPFKEKKKKKKRKKWEKKKRKKTYGTISARCFRHSNATSPTLTSLSAFGNSMHHHFNSWLSTATQKGLNITERVFITALRAVAQRRLSQA